MAYKLNNIDLTTYGIKAGRTTNSNIALSGFLDMPKRTGKTYHSWGDANGVEPYVSASEIFFDGRDIQFVGVLKSPSKYEAIYQLKDLYDDISAFTDKVDFETPYGTFEVYVKDEIKVEYLNNGWATLTISFRENIVEIPNPTLPTESDFQVYGIDGIPFKSYGCFVQLVKDNMNRSAIKKQEVTAYGYEGFQLTKTDLHKVSLDLVFHATSFATLKTNIGMLHKQLASEGLRQINIDTVLRESFAIDGFKVKNIKTGSNIAVAIVSVELVITELSSTGIDTWDTLNEYWNNVDETWDGGTEPTLNEVWNLLTEDWDNINGNWENINE